VSGAIHAGREHRGDLELDADVVVIGSGAGGAVVAAELAEAGERVVILEEGPHVPAERYQRMRPTESIRHLWRDGAMTFAVGVGDSPMINVTMGRCVGGSSVLTGGVCFRTPERILDGWVRGRGLAELTPDGLAPAFEAVERSLHVEEVPVAMRSRSTTLFGEGARRLGFELEPTRRNTHGCNGCGRCNFGCPHGAKLSVDHVYLPRAIRAGAELWSDALVDRIVVERGRAAGVVGRLLDGRRARRAGRLSVRARRVVVAAGGMHSPLLLQASGVGRRSGQVGRNLTLHPGFRMMAVFDQPVLGWKGALQSAFSDRYEEDDITLVSVFVPPAVLAATMPGVGPDLARRTREIPNLAMFGGMIHDEGGGRVHRAIGREPLVTYRMSRRNRATMPKVVRILAETFFAAGAREVILPILGMRPVDADAFRRLDLERIPARRFECSSQHPLGSCRMGADPRSSVVDPDGQAWDVQDLYVADGSIVPTSLGVNPQLTIMAMATRIAWKLRERPVARA
jgi:choline dehydrogenase-like flavoprotein